MLMAQSGALSVPSHPLKGSGYFSDSYTRPWAGEDSQAVCGFFACPAWQKSAHSWYDNYDATRWVVWLVDLVRERRDLSRVLRIGVCRSKQRRITAKKSAIGAEIHAESVLRPLG